MPKSPSLDVISAAMNANVPNSGLGVPGKEIDDLFEHETSHRMNNENNWPLLMSQSSFSPQ
jgi:hypothetical protein